MKTLITWRQWLGNGGLHRHAMWLTDGKVAVRLSAPDDGSCDYQRKPRQSVLCFALLLAYPEV
jgi:hypothetical protein